MDDTTTSPIPQPAETAKTEPAGDPAPVDSGPAPAGPSAPTTSTPEAPQPKAGAAPFRLWPVLQNILLIACISASVLTLWTPANLFSNRALGQMDAPRPGSTPAAENLPSPTPPATPRIGIVAGHWGNDSGTVCDDGLTEQEVNLRIATLVKQKLMAQGIEVDLLQEYDPRLNQYQALALISIHNDSCIYINDEATGYKVAPAMSDKHPEKAIRLTACLTQRYQAATNLRFHYNTITTDMTSYHAFDEINPLTPAAIIETGFMNLDREILTKRTDVIAKGVTDGILCYVRNEDIPQPAVTPSSSPTP